ncbi:7620_t:CDS:1, partial [Gigaspora rosea]
MDTYKKLGTASPIYFQLISLILFVIIEPITTKTGPEAHGGMLTKIGARNNEIKKKNDVAVDVD